MAYKNKEKAQSAIVGADLQAWLEALTGQLLPLKDESDVLSQVATSISTGQSLGYSQFNELLLTVGYDRVDREFFLYLCDPAAVSVDGVGTDEISSPEELHKGIDAFRELALLLYGNVKYGFKRLSRDPDTLNLFIRNYRRERSDSDFRSRHDPLVPLKEIKGKDAHLLGYISGEDIKKLLETDPSNPDFLAQKGYRDEILARGQWNHNVYLTFDHLDVYVATSMRARHEYLFVSDFMSRIETNPHIKDLKIRFFDPTRAYCKDRLDKGLAEALMLKRAACTVYLSQESDTLGKDSELASTLAQGKPVIALVPEMNEKFWHYLHGTFRDIYPEKSEEQRLMQLLQIYSPDVAWNDKTIKKHLSGQQKLDESQLTKKARSAVSEHYDKRAKLLKEIHPLGLQTNLNTGVANGVLVVRNVDVCAQLIRRILLNKMEFYIEDTEGYVLLKEKLTDCTFRMMTADRMLTNSFWNFYNVA